VGLHLLVRLIFSEGTFIYPPQAMKVGLEWLFTSMMKSLRVFMRYAQSNAMSLYLVLNAGVREKVLMVPALKAPPDQ
jgi:UDP-N-acetyl-D-mannosaminuronic acid transferase (WecB/TagA/CpsF family)